MNVAIPVPKEIKKIAKELTPGLLFQQETVKQGKQMTNSYTSIFDKSLFGFELFSSTQKHSLREVVKSKFNARGKKGYCIGINTNAFLMAEDGPSPKTWSYNLDVLNGTVLQLPANIRPTIVTKKGELSFCVLDAAGQIILDDKYFTWRGSHNFEEGSDFVAYGTFNIPQFRIEIDDKKFISSNYDSSWITAGKGETLLGFNLIGSSVVIDTISDERLNLFNFLFILKGEKKLIQHTVPGGILNSIVVDSINDANDLSAQSLISKLPREKKDIEAIFSKYIIKNTKIGNINLESFRKAWSVILQTQNSIAFIVLDARPKIMGQEGLNIFELHKLLTNRFDYIDAYVSDAGQSSKICIYNGEQCDVYGNLHYLDYVNDPPVWRGRDGRFVPGALLAYNRFT